MTNPIVIVNVSQQIAPTPDTLQKQGAFVSQGGTNTAPNTSSLLTQLADLTPLLKGAAALTLLAISSLTVTATAATAHGLPIGDPILLTIAGATPAGYNGTFLCVPTTTTQFTYQVASAPGSPTVYGSYTPEDVAELLAMATTFFAQGGQQAVSVLELGPDSVDNGVADLTAWITANPDTYYSYLVPRTWDNDAAFLAMLANFEATTSKTYFYVTTTLATYQAYSNLMKCVKAMIEAPVYGQWKANALTAISYSGGVVTATTTTAHGVQPGNYFSIAGVTSDTIPSGYNGTFLALPGTTGNTIIYNLPADPGTESVLGTLVASYYASAGVPVTEFSHAADFQHDLNYDPGATNRVTPNAFAFLFGVTPFPTRGNAALLTTLQAAFINIVGTGAEGGISDAILLRGTTKDGRDFTYWYSVDWVQIQINLAISNAIINGSNNPVNPLYYNQDGINRLQQVAASVMGSGVTFGLVLGNVVQTQLDGPDFDKALDNEDFTNLTPINAVPFVPYSLENPGDYKIGKYSGFAIVYTPTRGFEQVIFNVVVTDFVAQ